MTDATEKQVKFAESLGIANAGSFTKEALSKLINEKTGNKPFTTKKSFPVASNAQIPVVNQHDVIINRTEKPHSYEFGKASARHKIYYDFVENLIIQIDALKRAGLLDNFEDVQEQIKQEDKGEY